MQQQQKEEQSELRLNQMHYYLIADKKTLKKQ